MTGESWGKEQESSLLCHNQSVFSHAFYSWFLPFRFSFLSRLFFRFFVHCLTDGFGTMLWQQLVERKKSPPTVKIQLHSSNEIKKISSHVGGDFTTQRASPLITKHFDIKCLLQTTYHFINSNSSGRKKRGEKETELQKSTKSK